MRIRERFNPHAPFEARRRSLLQRSSCWANFNPRAPCGARHGADRERLGARRISTHAPLAGRDDSIGGSLAVQQDFNPRAPCGARRWAQSTATRARRNFNPRAPCGARRRPGIPRHVRHQISTHAPLAGRDPQGHRSAARHERISTHAPLAGRDVFCRGLSVYHHYFNPRAPCGARPGLSSRRNKYFVFQPTRPLRGATALKLEEREDEDISTHAPLAGRDGRKI